MLRAMALVLGVAFGPRSTSVEVRDAATGSLLSDGRARHVDLGPEVDIEDPTAWWRSLVAAAAQAGERDIAAISVCGSHPGLVLLDGAGAVLRPVQPWAEADTEPDAARLRHALGADRWAREAGMLPDPSSAVARLSWLRRTDPGTFGRIGAVLLPHDWLTYRLSGRRVTDRGSASLTGAWSPSTDSWITDVLDALGGRGATWLARLPEVLGPTERADWLTAPVYELLGLRGRPVVAPGTGESMAVALALGLRQGQAAVSLGTTTAVLAGLAKPVADATGGVQSHANASGGHLAVVMAPGGATLIHAIGDLLDLHPDELGALALAAGPDDDGPLLVPGMHGRDGGVLTGLRTGTTRAGLARAAFDGVACAALDGIDQIVDAGAGLDDEEPLRLTGPEPALEAHAQLLATLADRAVVPARAGSLAAAGACVQAAAILAGLPPQDVARAWDLGAGPTVEPEDDPSRLARRVANAEERTRQMRALLG